MLRLVAVFLVSLRRKVWSAATIQMSDISPIDHYSLVSLIYGLTEAPNVPMVLTYANVMDVISAGNS